MHVLTSGGRVAYDPGKEAYHYPYRVLKTPILMMWVLLRHLYHSAVAEFVATRQPGCTHDVTSKALCCFDAVLPSVRRDTSGGNLCLFVYDFHRICMARPYVCRLPPASDVDDKRWINGQRSNEYVKRL